MIVTLKRDPVWKKTHTMGLITVQDFDLRIHTIERPWLDNKPFESCVPAGRYSLQPFVRPDGTQTYALFSATRGVFVDPNDVPNVPHRTRNLILIHPGNRVADIVGCIAPGMTRTENTVGNSRVAFRTLMDALDREDGEEHTLIITRGT
jgi:hypothetical protein